MESRRNVELSLLLLALILSVGAYVIVGLVADNEVPSGSAASAEAEAASLTAEEAAASEEAAELAGALDAPQPTSTPASITPASRREHLFFSFIAVTSTYIVPKRL